MANELFPDGGRYALRHDPGGDNANNGMIAVNLSSAGGGGGGSLYVFPVIFSSCSVQHGEKTHLLEAFNEAIHVFAFGKTAGRISLQGYLLSTSSKNKKHADFSALLCDPYDKIRAFSAAKAGQKVMVSGPGGVVLSGVCSDFSYAMNGEMNNAITFNLSFITTSTVMGIGSK